MLFKGYRIVATTRHNSFFSTNEEGEVLEKLTDVYYMDAGDEDPWYSVVDQDNYVLQSFSNIDGCKDYILQELDSLEAN